MSNTDGYFKQSLVDTVVVFFFKKDLGKYSEDEWMMYSAGLLSTNPLSSIVIINNVEERPELPLPCRAAEAECSH